MTPAKGRGKVTVTIREGATLYVDGEARYAGATLSVTADEAKALREQGVVSGRSR